MQHFVAYHNSDRMGRSLHEGDPLALVTSRGADRLLHNMVWFVVGDGAAPKRYSLGSVFTVNEVGKNDGQDFKYYARGDGHVFDPPVPLDELDWFSEFFKKLAHFSLGVQEIKDSRFIDELKRLAADAGYHVP